MKHLRWMLAAVVAVPACSLLALHLIYSRELAPAASSPAGAAAGVPGPAAVGRSPAPEAALPAGAGSEAVPAAALPDAPPDRTHELALSDCVERKVRAAGVDRVPQTLPGRWPALKRAREVQRLRRLELRLACDRELSGQAF